MHYPSPVGSLATYVTPSPGPGEHPAIIWIAGGDYNSISDGNPADDVWSAAPADNDQTAAQYRDAGVMMMFPSLRGGNDNPGYEEGLMGEADDILAAADFLAQQPGVDPNRIYLGGHSTGGTMVLIESEYTSRFRAVFSFGPVADPSEYDPQEIAQPWDPANPRELYLRSPIHFLSSITKPTFVFEGTTPPSNITDLRLMASENTNPNAHFYAVDNYSHFSILAPMNTLIAQKINADNGPTCNIAFTPTEIEGLS
jgi:dipeptidyl aminopeptidase/acylaminoacyl peptidase